MEQEKITPSQQIEIIESSLKQVSSMKTGASNYYIIWGWILAAYFSIQFFHAHFMTELTGFLAEMSGILYLIGGGLSYIQTRKDDKNETVVPINEKIYSYGWIGASIGLVVLSIGLGLNQNSQNSFIEMACIAVLFVFGLVNFIIGGVTGFKPLLGGGLVSMLLVLAIPHVGVEQVFLLTAFGVLISCALPGHWMKKSSANV